MKKLFSYIVPIIALLFFIAIMLSGNFLKKPKNPSEDVLSFTEIILKNAKDENWSEAEKNVYNLEKAWNKVLPRIQFSVERDEIYNIGLNIARLKGEILSEDKSAILTELYELKENWIELSR